MDVFASETAPFAVAIGLTLAIAFIELLGLLLGAQPSAMVDSALPDLDADIPDMEVGPLSQSLSWLSFGKLPALVVLILILASFGLCGFALQEALRRTLGFALDPWLASVPAAIGAAFVTRHVGLAIARIMPKEETEAVSTKAFVGRVATVFRGVAGPGTPAEAKLTDIHGKTHYLLIEPDDGEPAMPEGSEVVIIRQQGPVYRAISKLKPAS
nr:YqiJ family protein [uncultured Devosia sp.]